MCVFANRQIKLEQVVLEELFSMEENEKLHWNTCPWRSEDEDGQNIATVQYSETFINIYTNAQEDKLTENLDWEKKFSGHVGRAPPPA